MFAGPNGSGKSTIKSVIDSNLIGIYVNPDEIELEIKQVGFLDFDRFEIRPSETEILEFFNSSQLLKKADLLEEAAALRFSDNKLSFFNVLVNSYFASVASDFIRTKLSDAGKSFTTETVMSSPDKIDLLKNAQRLGYRTYLYYVATADPEINVSRVQSRIESGGHSVPKDKIASRYKRSLSLLPDAIRYSNRAYIFDNSGAAPIWVAEITDGKTIESRAPGFPDWFKNAVWKNLDL